MKMVNPSQISALYKANETVQTILDYMALRQRNPQETSVDDLTKEFPSSSRKGIVKAFQDLEEVGAGKFKAGRKQFPSRIIWNTEISDLAKKIKGGEIEPSQSSSNQSKGAHKQESHEATTEHIDNHPRKTTTSATHRNSDETISYTFRLREDYLVNFELPKDLTVDEAERLGRYLTTLSLEPRYKSGPAPLMNFMKKFSNDE